DALSKASNNSGGILTKRTPGKWHVSINAFGGIGFGFENIKGTSPYVGVFGVTAPIGIHIADANRWGVFLSGFDLGAALSWRFTNSENIPNTITLKQIISPGAFISYSPMKSSAFTIMGGVQWTPKLREIIDQNNVPT